MGSHGGVAFDFNACTLAPRAVVADTVSPLPTPTSGWSEEGLTFDGVDDYVALPTWELGAEISFELYLRFNDFLQPKKLSKILYFADEEEGADGYQNLIQLGTTSHDIISKQQPIDLTFGMGTNRETWSPVATEGGAIQVGVWMHLVVTVALDGAINLYIDGALTQVRYTTRLVGGEPPTRVTRSVHWIGKSHWSGEQFRGTIRYLGVYDRNLASSALVSVTTALRIGLAGATTLAACEALPAGYDSCTGGVWSVGACQLVSPGHYNDGGVSGAQPCSSGT